MYVTCTMREVPGRVRHLLSTVARQRRWPMVLGTFLLAVSTAGVVATTNTPPEITHLRMPNQVNEGETVTLSGAFNDPYVGDPHAIIVLWQGDDNVVNQPHKQKILLEPGQTVFQVSHVYKDDFQPRPVKVIVVDGGPPPGTNDNADGGVLLDVELLPFEVRNVPPKFVEGSVKVQKADRGRVVVEGDLVDPGSEDKIAVEAAWGDPRIKAPTECTMSNNDRHFRCEHTYPSIFGMSRAYNLGVRAIDDDGGMANHQSSVRIP